MLRGPLGLVAGAAAIGTAVAAGALQLQAEALRGYDREKNRRAFSTVVHVEVGLLHEGDLERLFRELRSAEAGLFHIERCGIRRSGPDFVMRPGAINLSAECDLRWFTFARSEGGQ